MSVQAGPIFKRYAANGIATVYAVPFKVIDTGDLQITLDSVPVTTGFTIGALGGDSTSCTFSVPPTGDLLFQLVLPFQRLTDYQLNGDLLAVTVNRDLDRIWLALKQLIGSNDRALSTAISEPEGLASLPLKAARATKLLGFDVAGNPVVSNLTLAQLEEQPALAQAAASAAAESAESAGVSQAEALLYRNEALLYRNQAQVFAALLADPWAAKPIGVPIPLWTHIAGVTAPPTGAGYRYIKLTASDGYNTGALISEIVSGSAPLVQATAVINLVGSPMNGQTVRLINTERRVLRAGSGGTVESDQMQAHEHELGMGGSYLTQTGAAGTVRSGTAPSTNVLFTGPTQLSLGTASSVGGLPRTGNETRSKNIGADYYMRIL